MPYDRKLIDTTTFKSLAKEGGNTSVLLAKQYIPDFVEKIVGDDEKDTRKIKFVISTETVDRYGDVVKVDGWQLKNFKRNPVVLWSHFSTQTPLAKASGVKVEDNKLVATAEFMDDSVDRSGFADSIYQMITNGYLRATSVGFLPLEYDWVEEDNKRRGGVDFLKQDLLEFSIVPVPANPEALIDASKKGINIGPMKDWYEETLDNWLEHKDSILIPRSQAETFYKTMETIMSKSHQKSFNLSEAQQDELLKKNLEAVKKQAFEGLKQKLLDGEQVSVGEEDRDSLISDPDIKELSLDISEQDDLYLIELSSAKEEETSFETDVEPEPNIEPEVDGITLELESELSEDVPEKGHRVFHKTGLAWATFGTKFGELKITVHAPEDVDKLLEIAKTLNVKIDGIEISSEEEISVESDSVSDSPVVEEPEISQEMVDKLVSEKLAEVLNEKHLQEMIDKETTRIVNKILGTVEDNPEFTPVTDL